MSDQETIVEKIEANKNTDPISDEIGSQPVDTGMNATRRGIAGAIVGGILGGPIGAIVGAAFYGVMGGSVGKEAAEEINPTIEKEYWRANYSSRHYVDSSISYEHYEPAYQQGWEAGLRYAGKTYDEIEPELQNNWETCNTVPSLTWDKAKPATRDAWDRLQEHRNKYVPK